MEIVQALLKHIQPNPFQPREGEDPAHVKNVALSIAQDGLLQIPLARIVTPAGLGIEDSAERLRGNPIDQLVASGYCLQLVFGHTRLAAFKWLEDVKPHSDLKGDWSRMPLIITDLTDEEMFRRGISENLARKDLTPIEEGKAMLVYREKFGKTSAEIGQLFHLSDSAVRNKMRLLTLPDFLQDDLRTGLITEGVGRALVALFDIPEAQRLQAEDSDDLKPSEIVAAARSGISPDKTGELVTRLSRRLVPHADQTPLPAPLPEPLPTPAVSMETVYDESEDGETEDNENNEEQPAVTQPAAVPVPSQPMPTRAPTAEDWKKPDPAKNIPDPRYSQPAASQPVARPQPAAQPAPAAPVVPAPAPAPVALPWEKSTILLSLTLWPEDSQAESLGRMVSIGARVNQGNPLMAMARMNDISLPGQLQEMLNKMHQLALDGEAK